MATSTATTDLIARSRGGDQQAREQLFESFRPYLRLLAQAQIGRHLRTKCDPSDIVQQTFLEAHRDFGGFSGQHEAELLAWMRQILAHNLFNETRRFGAQRRNSKREVSLDQMRADLDHSSVLLGRTLAAKGVSPSQAAARHEDTVRVADVLCRLPEDYQTVLLLRIFEGLSAEEVGQRMNRSAGAVRMLQLRAVNEMRDLLHHSGVQPP